MLTIVKHVDTCLHLTELTTDIGELKQIKKKLWNFVAGKKSHDTIIRLYNVLYTYAGVNFF